MTDVVEGVTVAVPAATAYRAVAEMRRMASWSPECIGIWVLRRRPDGGPRSFVGFNRRGLFVWFTTCRVVVAEPDREFAFEVRTFGMPVSRWGYRFLPAGDGTRIEESWVDQRSRATGALGRIFTGRAARMRGQVNREGMKVTLERLRAELESGAAGA